MLIYGYISSFNRNGNIINLVVNNHLKEEFNIKTSEEVFASLKESYIYGFEVEEEYGKRTKLNLIKVLEVNNLSYLERFGVLGNYQKTCKEDIKVVHDKIYNFIDGIKHPELKTLVKTIINDHKDDYFSFPAGIRMHHAYLGGIAVHTLRMLQHALSFFELYPNLNQDLVLSGLLLHDVAKIFEYDDIQTLQFSLKGHLFGHLVMAVELINDYTRRLDLKDLKMIDFLKHIILSHHGELEFGSPKKPYIFEALIVSRLDDMNSKFDPAYDVLEETKVGEVSEGILPLQRTKFYKI